jgi:hypothetical protein
MALVSEVTAIGWRAHAALTASGGRARMVATLSASFYAEAAGELIWVGPSRSALHPRAVLGPSAPSNGGTMAIAPGDVRPWRPAATAIAPGDRREAGRLLRGALARLGAPGGFARLGTPDLNDDPILARARPAAEQLVLAVRANDASGFVNAALPLLGLGEGLTPAGDDFVGGALFGRRCRAAGSSSEWDAAIGRLLDEARTRTHPLSAQLLSDLAAGEAWAPLHDLAGALAARQPDAVRSAAKALTAIGHSSGWDLLGGFALAFVD